MLGMKISFNWIKDYVNLPDSISAEEVAEKLKLATVEVEGIEKQGELLQNVVVGKVIKAEKHPEADKLKLCSVNIGSENLQIVCGGSNVREGMFVALAKVGAKVRWHGEEELMELKPTAIRGIESFGMICGANEIGLEFIFPPEDEREIVDLSKVATDKNIGKPLAEILKLNDTVFEIDNKSLSHRPDLWGHYGLAREVAVLFGKNLKEYEVKPFKGVKNGLQLSVEIKDSGLCPRYMAVAVSGIKPGQSPSWMKQRLSAVGLRPINKIVDITNYIMLDLGEPMHAFDANHIENNKIIVRLAEKGEILTLLDENKIEFTADDLVIADSEKPLALAGVMGGEMSGIGQNTETVVFEAANFNASSIRQSSIRHGQRTDSSSRFEKSLDPTWCEMAIGRAVELTLECCPEAKVSSQIIDKKDYVLKTGPIVLEKDVFKKKLGVNIPEKEVEKILTKLGFKVVDKGNNFSVSIPTWRATKDVSIAEDLVEEVARIYGYDRIESALPTFSIVPPKIEKTKELEITIRDIFSRNLSYDEVYNYSFISRDQVNKMGDSKEYLELDNPLSKEKPFLRRSLTPNLIESAVKNIEYFDRVAIYEIGKVFWADAPGFRSDLKGDDLLPRQDTWLTALFTEKKNENPLIEVRRALELITREYILDFSIVSSDALEPWKHPTRTGEIKVGEQIIGTLYELDPIVAKDFGLNTRAGLLEINFSALAEVIDSAAPVKYKKPSVYPEVERDLAFIVDKEVSHEMIRQSLIKADSLIEEIELFDIFDSNKLGENKKSMAYRIIMTHPERTLNSKEVDSAMKKILDILTKKFKAEVRG